MTYPFKSITQLHDLLEIEPPKHPMVSVIDFSSIKCFSDPSLESVTYSFYCIALKKNFKGKMKYGMQYVDFNKGIMIFFKPHQVVTTTLIDEIKLEGYWLVIHPDFLKGFPLDHKIKNYDFFSYKASEALHLSEEEEQIITSLMQDVNKEIKGPMDRFTHEIIVSQIDLLLHYVARFYERQFRTSTSKQHDILTQFEEILHQSFELKSGSNFITVEEIAARLHLSPNYLSDLLRSISGMSTQEFLLQFKLEKAKELLTSTQFSVSEIAYQLGYEFPQSFSKFFKQKTKQSPVEFRAKFN
ncbi:AraC family transcriptional regulator [Weeksellaceae bacterium A-14]